jgi:ABC-type polysaccharide/polyol phosphate export permease
VTTEWSTWGELKKIPAFVRRDFLVTWSYRLAFLSDFVNMFVQVITFGLVGQMVNPTSLPEYGGTQPGYVEFVVVGIVVTSFLQIALSRVVNVIRQEQFQGTLEAIMMTPTSISMFQIGSVAYDLIYVPVRTTLFLVVVSLIANITFTASGYFLAIPILLVFIPFVWGLGIITAAATLTFRRGAGLITFFVTGLVLLSESYFPISLFPSWLESIARLNPLYVALRSVRELIIGSSGWEILPGTLGYLAPWAAVSLMAGTWAFRWALARERRAGTLGAY